MFPDEDYIVLIDHAYGHDTGWFLGTKFNFMNVRWLVQNHVRYSHILLVGGSVPGMVTPTIGEWQYERLIKQRVSENKLYTISSVGLKIKPARETIEEIWVAFEILNKLRIKCSEITQLNALCMSYHAKRVNACYTTLGLTPVIHTIEGVNSKPGVSFYNWLAWLALETSNRGGGFLLNLVRLTRTQSGFFLPSARDLTQL